MCLPRLATTCHGAPQTKKIRGKQKIIPCWLWFSRCSIFAPKKQQHTLWWTNSSQWKITMLLMGKSTISMAMFNCYVSSPKCISDDIWLILYYPTDSGLIFPLSQRQVGGLPNQQAAPAFRTAPPIRPDKGSGTDTFGDVVSLTGVNHGLEPTSELQFFSEIHGKSTTPWSMTDGGSWKETHGGFLTETHHERKVKTKASG